MIEGVQGEAGKTASPQAMKSEEHFSQLINRITTSLEEIGLYSINCDAILHGESYCSYDDLRSKIINNKTFLRIDIDCFIGETAWHSDRTEFFMKIAEMDIEDFSKFFLE